MNCTGFFDCSTRTMVELLASAAAACTIPGPSIPSCSQYWYWRKRGRGSYRILFRPNNEHTVKVLTYLDVEAKKTNNKDLVVHNYKFHGRTMRFVIPYCTFRVSTKSHRIVPLVSTSGEVVGCDFWTCCMFWYGSRNQYNRMLRFIRDLTQLPIFKTRRRQVVPWNS